MTTHTPAARRRPYGTPEEAPPTYPAEAARQGRIVLQTQAQRRIFVGGLVGLSVLLVVLVVADLMVSVA